MSMYAHIVTHTAGLLSTHNFSTLFHTGPRVKRLAPSNSIFNTEGKVSYSCIPVYLRNSNYNEYVSYQAGLIQNRKGCDCQLFPQCGEQPSYGGGNPASLPPSHGRTKKPSTHTQQGGNVNDQRAVITTATGTVSGQPGFLASLSPQEACPPSTHPLTSHTQSNQSIGNHRSGQQTVLCIYIYIQEQGSWL